LKCIEGPTSRAHKKMAALYLEQPFTIFFSGLKH
jgi:hypothetical protein